MKVQFNKAVVNTLPVGTHQDTKQQGLVLNVTPTSRRFGVYISIRSVPTRKSIGATADWSVEAARLEASKLITEMRSSEISRVKSYTIGALADMYTARLEGLGRRRSGYVTADMRLNWGSIMNRELDDISVVELTYIHDAILTSRGLAAASRAIRTLRTLYTYAEELELVTRNPAKRVRVSTLKSRDVFLNEDECSLLLECVSYMAETPRDFFKLALLTGLRRSNLLGLKWSWVDLTNAVVTIPASAAKGKAEMALPLATEAVKILAARASRETRSAMWVFPSCFTDKHVASCESWIEALRGEMKARGCSKHFTLHDLRRTFATRLISRGAPLPVVAKALGHASLATVSVYARASDNTVREWLA